MKDRLMSAEEMEELTARFEQNLGTWLASFGELLDVGDHDSLEILLEEEGHPVAEIWDSLANKERQRLLRTAGEILGVDLLRMSPDQIVCHYHLDGVPGEKTEGGVEVDTLETVTQGLMVHVLHYQNPKVGTRYDLVRTA